MTQQLNIRLEGEKAIEYLREDSKDRIKTIKYILFGVGFLIGFVFIVVGISVMLGSSSPPSDSIVRVWFNVTTIMAQGSWTVVTKFLLLLFAPVIALSWLFHGVQARLFA
jgi:uncharacterized membrane protein YciS (DUF1049 family)